MESGYRVLKAFGSAFTVSRMISSQNENKNSFILMEKMREIESEGS